MQVDEFGFPIDSANEVTPSLEEANVDLDEEALIAEIEESEIADTNLATESATLARIVSEIETHGISKHHALSLESINPNYIPKNCPLNSFTATPTRTNRDLVLRTVSNENAFLGAAAFFAAIALVSKIFRWILKKLDGGGTAARGNAAFGSFKMNWYVTVSRMETIDLKSEAAREAFDVMGRRVNVSTLHLIKNPPSAKHLIPLFDYIADCANQYEKMVGPTTDLMKVLGKGVNDKDDEIAAAKKKFDQVTFQDIPVKTLEGLTGFDGKWGVVTDNDYSRAMMEFKTYLSVGTELENLEASVMRATGQLETAKMAKAIEGIWENAQMDKMEGSDRDITKELERSSDKLTAALKSAGDGKKMDTSLSGNAAFIDVKSALTNRAKYIMYLTNVANSSALGIVKLMEDWKKVCEVLAKEQKGPKVVNGDNTDPKLIGSNEDDSDLPPEDTEIENTLSQEAGFPTNKIAVAAITAAVAVLVSKIVSWIIDKLFGLGKRADQLAGTAGKVKETADKIKSKGGVDDRVIAKKTNTEEESKELLEKIQAADTSLIHRYIKKPKDIRLLESLMLSLEKETEQIEHNFNTYGKALSAMGKSPAHERDFLGVASEVGGRLPISFLLDDVASLLEAPDLKVKPRTDGDNSSPQKNDFSGYIAALRETIDKRATTPANDSFYISNGTLNAESFVSDLCEEIINVYGGDKYIRAGKMIDENLKSMSERLDIVSKNVENTSDTFEQPIINAVRHARININAQMQFVSQVVLLQDKTQKQLDKFNLAIRAYLEYLLKQITAIEKSA